jgi:hypothetical protein
MKLKHLLCGTSLLLVLGGCQTANNQTDECFGNALHLPQLYNDSIVERFPKIISERPNFSVGDIYKYTVWTSSDYPTAKGECTEQIVQYKIISLKGDSLSIQESSSTENITYSMALGDSMIPASFTPRIHPFGFPLRWTAPLYHIPFPSDTLYDFFGGGGQLSALFGEKYGLLYGQYWGANGMQTAVLLKYKDSTISQTLMTQWDDSLIAWRK